MSADTFLTVGFFCLAALTCIVGFFVFVKRQRTIAAISERICNLNMPGVTMPQLAISIPTEWRYSRIDGPGFYMHSFSAPDNAGNITAYVGNNPSIRKEMTSRKRTGCVGGKKVKFFSAMTGRTVIFQTVVKGFFAESGNSAISGLVLHIMIAAQENRFANKAFRALKTLQLVR